MNRFTEECAADLARGFRQHSRCFRDEDGCPDIEESQVIDDGVIPDRDTPERPWCARARAIFAIRQTVGELCDALAMHKVACRTCNPALPLTVPAAERKVA